MARKRGFRVFLDLKFHDIPNTVAGATRETARLGVFMLDVHASGGVAMMRAAAEAATRAAQDFAVPRPLVLGVTVLTSLDRRALQQEVGVAVSVDAHVLHLADRARAAGLDGCVASPREIGPLRLALGPDWVIVTPGIRSSPRTDDQTRVATRVWSSVRGELRIPGVTMTQSGPSARRSGPISRGDATQPSSPAARARSARCRTCASTLTATPTSCWSARRSRLVSTVTPRTSGRGTAKSCAALVAASAAARIIATPPLACTSGMNTPGRAVSRVAPATVFGMSWNLRSRKTRKPRLRAISTAAGPAAVNSRDTIM